MRKGDTVYIHPEAEYHPSTTLQSIINAGLIPSIAINPEYTPKGVAGFVLGTTLLFGKEQSYEETLKNIRELIF